MASPLNAAGTGLELVSVVFRNSRSPVSRNWEVLHGAEWIPRSLANHERGIYFVFAFWTGSFEVGTLGHDSGTRQVKPRHVN